MVELIQIVMEATLNCIYWTYLKTCDFFAEKMSTVINVENYNERFNQAMFGL